MGHEDDADVATPAVFPAAQLSARVTCSLRLPPPPSTLLSLPLARHPPNAICMQHGCYSCLSRNPPFEFYGLGGQMCTFLLPKQITELKGTLHQ